MTDTKALYSFIFRAFIDNGEQTTSLTEILKAAEQAGIAGAWDIDRATLRNAMNILGIEVRDGMLFRNVLHEIELQPNDFALFIGAAKAVIKELGRPATADQIISMSGIKSSEIPYGGIEETLTKAGLHFIPGAGYWKYTQYSDQRTGLIMHKAGSHRRAKLADVFRQYGWPLDGREIEEYSGGEVTSKYLTRLAVHKDSSPIRSLAQGSGLYVPADQRGQFPMSPTVAKALLDIHEGRMITDKESLRIFRLVVLMGRAGLANVTQSRTVRRGQRLQTAKVSFTDKALRQLYRQANITFEAF